MIFSMLMSMKLLSSELEQDWSRTGAGLAQICCAPVLKGPVFCSSAPVAPVLYKDRQLEWSKPDPGRKTGGLCL
jgi:hypothetical protein